MIAAALESASVMTHFWSGVASAALVVAVWASQKASPVHPIDDLIDRLRHPVRWTFRHPIISVKRKLDRRQ